MATNMTQVYGSGRWAVVFVYGDVEVYTMGEKTE